MEYRVIFDVVRQGHHPWPLDGLIFLFVLAGALLLLRKRLHAFQVAFLRIALGFMLLWNLLAWTGTFSKHSELSSALHEGRCAVAEGTVTQFHPMPSAGHQNEWFVVDGQRFEYSDFEETGGFNNTRSHGGPIYLGVHVRVHSFKGKIARLEVAPPPVSPASYQPRASAEGRGAPLP